ncbi:hypothetical protein PISMIDRAFT_681750, partial [Pisolithus microcarpus 441]
MGIYILQNNALRVTMVYTILSISYSIRKTWYGATGRQHPSRVSTLSSHMDDVWRRSPVTGFRHGTTARVTNNSEYNTHKNQK